MLNIAYEQLLYMKFYQKQPRMLDSIDSPKPLQRVATISCFVF